MFNISGFGIVLLFIVGGISFLLVTLLVAKILRPNRPNPEKNSIYESGEEPAGSAWGQFNIRFYVVTLVFLLFEAELVFLFPWAAVFGKLEFVEETNGLWSILSMTEAFIFIVILAIGLAYVWANGMLNWVRNAQKKSTFKSKVPNSAYAKFS